MPFLRALRWLAGASLAGLLLGVIGPFGSYLNGDLMTRIGYWLAAMVLGLALYGGALTLLNATALSGALARWLVLFGVILIASIPEALLTRAAALWLWPELTDLGPGLWGWYGQTLVIGFVATGAMTILARRRSSADQQDDAPALASSISGKWLAGDVLALRMEDHYVRIYRPEGSELVLMPLGQAIAGLNAEGLRTHRSWWVARHAVTAIDSTPRAMRIHLSNGIVAPVARSAVVHLKAAGWMKA